MTSSRRAFLFGAGASYGAGYILPAAPPLGNTLYDILAREYPGNWGPNSFIGSRYAAGLRTNFEETFTNEIAPRFPPIHIVECYCDVAHFFSRFSLEGKGKDLYSRLLAFLESRHLLTAATFASLNYECLLELAAEGLGLSVNYFTRESDPAALQVLKLHGSCNFITDELSQWRPHLSSPGFHIGARLNTLPLRNLHKALDAKLRESVHGRYFYPILSLYAVGKDNHIATEKIQAFRNAWINEVAQATHLAIVGVRFTPADTHITDPVRDTASPTVLYIGSTADFEGWQRINPNCRHLGETWEESFDQLCQCLL